MDFKNKKDNFYADLDELQEVIEYLNKNEIKFSEGKEEETEESRKKVRSLIYEKTGMEFIDGKYIVPNNLRDLVNIISFLEKMPDLKEEEQDNKTMTNNFLLWKEYIFEIWIKKYLSIKQQQILKELYERNVEEKNKYIINKIEDLYDLLEKDDKFKNRRKFNEKEEYTSFEKEYQDIINLNNNPKNICLGDVLFVLDKAKKYKVELQEQRFIYAIKMVYSIMLSEIYELSREKEESKPIFKENIIYYDYQKLLGGYLYPERKLMRKSRNRLILERKDIKAFIKVLNCNFKEQEIYKFFDIFRVKTDKIYYQEKRRRESRKLEESLYKNLSIEIGEKIEFDIFGFLFNIRGKDFYIKNIEILEKIISRNYKGNMPSEYINHLEKFINEYKKPIKFGFENKKIELIKDGDTVNFIENFIQKLNNKENSVVKDNFNKLMDSGSQEVKIDIILEIIDNYFSKKGETPNQKNIENWKNKFKDFENFKELKGNFNKKEFLKKISEIKSEDLIVYNIQNKKVDQDGVQGRKIEIINEFKKIVEDYFDAEENK